MWRRLKIAIPHIKVIMYSAEDILNAREERVEFQQELIEQFNQTLIAMRVNYPGINKDNYITRGIISIMKDELYTLFKDKILFKKEEITAEGPLIFIVTEEDSKRAKIKTIKLEHEHSLGRLLDIDVYHKVGNSLSRSELGFKKRKCFICNFDAHLCVRTRKHEEDEIINFIKKRYEKYLQVGK